MRFFTVIFALLSFFTVGQAQGWVSQSPASFNNSCIYGDCDASFFARNSLMTAYPTGSNFNVTCSGVPPSPTTEYCGLRIRFHTFPPSTFTFAVLTYVSPTQVNFIIPPFYSGMSGSTAGINGIEIERLSSGSWVFDRGQQYVVNNVAPQTFIITRNGFKWVNGDVYGWNGSQYVFQRKIVDTAGGDITPIPKTYGGQPTILVYYVTGSWANPSANMVTINGVSYAPLYSGSSGFTGLEQVNVQVPSNAPSGITTTAITSAGFSYPNTCHLWFE